ncbi:MAG: hypothetical protein LBL26_08020 [Peptococcaceae bacterium]|nr:hypothetical protein [Peptococcaceae bacterium]
MRAISGYFESGRFTPYEAVKIRRRVDAILIIQDMEQTDGRTRMEEMNRLVGEVKDEEKELRAAWIRRLETAVSLSLDENLPDIPRSQLMREPLDLTD